MKLLGKTILLTGAGGAIGRETAYCLAGEGANMVLCDVREENILPVAQKIREDGGRAITCVFDVRNYQGALDAAEAGKEAFGQIDILINNAGGSAALINKISSFADSVPETWEFVMGLNVQGSFNCTHAVLKDMIARKSGKIIFFGSIAGVGGLANRADYSAAKGALISFTKALAMEVGPYNIQVNCISPGAIHRNGVPMPGMTYLGKEGNSGGPEHIGKMCVFLASEDADFITGQNYQVDGGRTLGSRS